MLNFAQKLASLGYPVFPCSGKQPWPGCKWQQEATTDPLKILHLFTGLNRNIGIAVPIGTVVIDLDRKPGKPNGIKAFSELMPEGWKYTSSKVKTGFNGLHLWFRVASILDIGNSRGDLPPGIDVKGGGKGYIIAPPSIHPDTQARYEWLSPAVAVAELPELPGWLLQRLLAQLAAPARSTLASTFPGAETASDSYLEGAVKSAADRVLEAPRGERNNTLNQEAYDLAGLAARGLDLHWAEERLFTAADQAGLTAREARATIRSAFRSGSQRVRDIPERARAGAQAPQQTQGSASPGSRAQDGQPNQSPEPSGARDREVPPASAGPNLPVIFIRTDEKRVNDEAAAALAARNYPDLYQRSGGLVRIVRTKNRPQDPDITEPGLSLADGTPAIRPMGLATLRERLADVAQWQKFETRGEPRWVPAHPPEWSTKAVAARGEWDNIYPLAGIADYPLIRTDGSLSSETGYDRQTAYYLGAGIKGLKIPVTPGRVEAEKAAARLFKLVDDFPFSNDTDRAAWLALLLTPLARAITSGPTPLFVVEANVRGSGKTLLTNIVGLILTGRDLPTQTYAQADEELEKILVSIARLGLSMVCFDNIKGTVGGGTLDKWLTSLTPSGRVLGSNDLPIFDWQTTLIATTNNAAVSGDTDRRSIYIKLETDHERPELRDDFVLDDIRKHVLKERSSYLADALTILRVHALAGWAEQGGRAKGSFEHWTRRVRDAVMLAGLPDCERPPDDPSRPVDRDREILGPLLMGIQEAFGDGEITVGDLLEEAYPSHREPYQEARLLREALASMDYKGGKPSHQLLGRRLSIYRGRWLSDMCFARRFDSHRKQYLWSVITREPAGIAGIEIATQGEYPQGKQQQSLGVAGSAGTAGIESTLAHENGKGSSSQNNVNCKLAVDRSLAPRAGIPAKYPQYPQGETEEF